jgi:hypothetical protein
VNGLARRLSALLRGVAATLTILASACQSSSGGRPSDSTGDRVIAGTPSQTSGARVSTVRLERQACFGTCPVYVLDVDSTGHVRFEGLAHVRVLGPASAVIGREAFTDLAERIMASGFPSFQAAYVAGTSECGVYATDLPVVVLSAVLDGAPKQVVHDYGCSGAPRVLRRLHQLIDSVANTSRWLLESSPTPLNQ